MQVLDLATKSPNTHMNIFIAILAIELDLPLS